MLLKNNGILPLNPNGGKSIAVIGTDASSGVQTIGGGSGTVTSPGTYTPLYSIQQRLAGTSDTVELQRRQQPGLGRGPGPVVQRGDCLRQRQLRARGGRHHHAQPAEQPGRPDLRRRGGQPEHDRGAQRQLGDPHAVAQPSGRGVRGLLRRPGRGPGDRRTAVRRRQPVGPPAGHVPDLAVRAARQYRRAVAGHERPGAVFRGPGHRVPLVRREQRHPAVPVRVRPVLYLVLVQQPARRGDVRQRRPRSPRR